MTRAFLLDVRCDEPGCELWWQSFAITVGQQRAAAREGGWSLSRRHDLCPDHNQPTERSA